MRSPRRRWRSLAPLLLVAAAPGCMGFWFLEQRLAPAAGQASVPGPGVGRLNDHEAFTLVEHDTSIAAVRTSDVTVTAWAVASELIPIGWGPFFLPLTPHWLVELPKSWLTRAPGEVYVHIWVRRATGWLTTVTLDPRDVALLADGTARAPHELLSDFGPHGDSAYFRATFQVKDQIAPMALALRRVHAGDAVVGGFPLVRFEPDRALTWWLVP